MVEFRRRVESFFAILDEQILEMDLEEKNKLSIRLAFDAKDMRYAIFGMHDLFDGQRFSTELFRADAAMVQALGFGGWLGPLYMLQPHQSELLAALREPRIAKVRHWEQFVLDFLREISYKQTIPSVRDLDPKSLVKQVTRYAGSTYEAFKAFQFINNARQWKERLRQLRIAGILNIARPEVVDGSMLSTDEFQRIKAVIDERRKKTPLNNFADAVALSLLKNNVARFNSGKQDVLFVYFDSSGQHGNSSFFRHVVYRARLADRYRYWLGERAFSVLKPASYFRFRGMFRPSRTVRASDDDSPLLQEGGLKKLHAEIGDILKARRVTEDIEISSARLRLGELISNLEDLSFFKHVWERNEAEQVARNILNELNLGALAEREFIGGVDIALKETLAELEQNTAEYRWIGNLWSRLKDDFKPLKIGRIERDFRLARFSFPALVSPWVEGVLSRLGNTEDEEERKIAFTTVVTECFRAIRGEETNPGGGGEESLRALALAAALLWLVGMYDELISLLEKHRTLPHHSFRLLHVAAVIQKRKRRRVDFAGPLDDWISSKLRELAAECRAATDGRLRGEVAAGLAYLLFELLLSDGFYARWREEGLTLPKGFSFDAEVLITDAVRWSREAYDCLKDLDPFKAAYALNQRLYYMVEGDAGSLKEMKRLARQLFGIRDRTPEFWQYTYFDTLARYEHRLALSEERPELKMERLREALHLAESAVNGSNGEDLQMLSYRDCIKEIVMDTA